MSEPTPAAPLTPEELERWAVATILETVRWSQIPKGSQARLKREGTRALRGMPFTFYLNDSMATRIFHGTITCVMLNSSVEFGHHIILVSTIAGADGDRVMFLTYNQTGNGDRMGWINRMSTNGHAVVASLLSAGVTDAQYLVPDRIPGTLEIG